MQCIHNLFQEVHSIVERAYNKTETLLKNNLEKLNKVCEWSVHAIYICHIK